MKKDIHPESYRPVVFKDMSNGDTFISRSTVNARETIDIDGQTLPLVKLEISNSSHPFYTGKSNLVDTAGRVDSSKHVMQIAEKNSSLLRQNNNLPSFCGVFVFFLSRMNFL
jgi:large subunit ribosomal protein L31